MNIELAYRIIHSLVKKGVGSFCMCPGGRLAPFVEVLSKSQGIEVLNFYDERSAGFFALGRSERTQKPVAVLTTSGTAVSNILPSVIEAHYSGESLVLITADRPIGYGEAGSPQTLKGQKELLKPYVSLSQSISRKEDLNLSKWNSRGGSLHLNVSFCEPLIDLDKKNFNFSREIQKQKTQNLIKTPFKNASTVGLGSSNLMSFKQLCNVYGGQSIVSLSPGRSFKEFCNTYRKPLVVLGEIKPPFISKVEEVLQSYSGLLYSEPLSNLTHLESSLFGGEETLVQAQKRGVFDSVIRIGGVPRARFWRDLEFSKTPVCNIVFPPGYPGLCRSSLSYSFFHIFEELESYLSTLSSYSLDFVLQVRKVEKQWLQEISKYTESEIYWMRSLKESLPPESDIFLGNSSPIRLWDLVSFHGDKKCFVRGQPGVNGIDGLVSRFLGGLNDHGVAVLGDLSLLYDLSGFWEAYKRASFDLIVMNNHGGKIFSRLFQNPAFYNSHKLSFSPVAKLWGLEYEKRDKPFDCPFFSKRGHRLVEICPNSITTTKHFKTYDSIWSS